MSSAYWNGGPNYITRNQFLSSASNSVTPVGPSVFSTIFAKDGYFSSLTVVSTYSSNITASSITTNLLNAQTLNLSTLNAPRGNISTIFTSTLNTLTLNAPRGNISTIFTSTLNTLIANGTTANFTTLNATTGNFTSITGNLTGNVTGNLTGNVSGSITGVAGNFSDLTVNNNARFNNNITDFTHKTLSNVDTIHSGSNSALIGCNLTLRGTNALLGYGGNVEFDADQGSLVAAEAVVTLKAKNGNRGKISLEAEPGYAGIQGEINLTATGGTPPSATSLGGRIHLSATTPNPITTVSPSYVLQTADSILAYAGGLSPISGNYGYNYQQGLNGVNIVAGTVASIPNVPGTVYLYGTNLAGTGNSGGVRITNGASIDVIYPYPTGFTSQPYDLILKGNAAGNKVTLSNVREIAGDSATLSGFTNLTATTVYATSLSTFQNGFISSLTVNQLLGVTTGGTGGISTFSTLTSQSGFISSLRVNELLGTPLISTFSTLTSQSGFISSLRVNELLGTPLISTFSTLTSQTAYISTLTVDDLVFSRFREDFSILNVSSLFASTLTCGSAFITSAGFDSISTNKISTGSLYVGNSVIVNSITTNISTTSFTADTATINQLNASNITLQNTPTFSIEQALFSTTIEGYGNISSIKNLILSTSIGFTAGTQEIQPFIPQYTVSTSNVGQWASTIFRLITSREGTQNFLGNLTPLTGGQVTYSNAPTSPRAITLVNQAGGTTFTVPIGSNYQYSWNGSAWSENRNPTPGSTTYGTSFSLFQTVNNTTLQTPDTLTFDAGNSLFPGVVTITNNLVATSGFFQSTTTSNLATSNITTSIITTSNLTASNINTSNMTACNINFFQLDGAVAYDSSGFFQTATNPNIGARIKYNGPDIQNFYLNAYPWVTGLGTTTTIETQLNYTAYPGGNFTLISTPSTIVGTVLNSDGTITSLAQTFSNTWISSIMGVYGGTLANPVQITMAQGFSSEFILKGLAPGEGRYEFQFNNLGYNIAIPFGGYHKWTYTGPGFTSNFSATPYPTVPGTDFFQIIQSPGGRNTFQGSNFDFNFLPIIQYSASANGNIGASGPGGVYGRATVSGIPIQYGGLRIKAADYVVKVSFSGYYCDQSSLAVTSVNANVTQDGEYLVLRLTLDTATVAGTTGCHWYYDVVCTPKCLALGAVNSTAPFEEKVWAPIRMPGLEVSSITASTISMFATENILLNAALPFEAVIGVGNIGLNASTNVNLMANYDINLDAFQNMYLTATSSINLSNAAGSAFMGIDEIGTTALFGSNVVLVANNDVFMSSSNVITIQSLSTINTTSYNYYQAASNLTELHNENYSNTSRTSAHHITNNFVVSTCLNSYYIKSVRQPFIQYGEFSSSGNNGSNLVVLPVPYSSIRAYKAFACMEDTQPSEVSVNRLSPSTFTVYWEQAGSGSHTIAWNTMGDVECGGAAPPPPVESAAYDLVNDTFGDTGYFTWSQDGSPDYEQVYTLQSVDDGEYSIYMTNTVYTPELTLYSLAQGYWYKFYVSSHYGDSPRVESSNSSAVYVNYI